MLVVAPIVGLCFVVRYFVSNTSFAIILVGKRELGALLCLSCWCLLIFEWRFPAVARVCLQFVNVVFLDHSHLLFLLQNRIKMLFSEKVSTTHIYFDKTMYDIFGFSEVKQRASVITCKVRSILFARCFL